MRVCASVFFHHTGSPLGSFLEVHGEEEEATAADEQENESKTEVVIEDKGIDERFCDYECPRLNFILSRTCLARCRSKAQWIDANSVPRSSAFVISRRKGHQRDRQWRRIDPGPADGCRLPPPRPAVAGCGSYVEIVRMKCPPAYPALTRRPLFFPS